MSRRSIPLPAESRQVNLYSNMRDSRRTFLRNAMGMSGAAALHAADNGPTIWDRAAMNRVVTAFMQEHQVPGLSVAVADHEELVHERAYGMANRENREELTPAHRFRIASVSKPITSVAIFQLIEQGKLNLEDPVFGPGAILGTDFGRPPYKPHVADIRLKHLRSEEHTSELQSLRHL